MKKENNNKTKLTGVILGLVIGILLTSGVAYAAVYYDWVGTPNYKQSKEYVGKIKTGVDTLVTNNSELQDKVEKLESDNLGTVEYYEERLEILEKVIKELEKSVEIRDESVLELQNSIIERDNIIEELREIIESDENQLNQALLDMKDIESDLSEIVGMLN